MEDQIANNPCIKFVVDNFDMLCLAHAGRVVMVMNRKYVIGKEPEAYVAKTFDSLEEAMIYTDALDINHIPFVLKECCGQNPLDRLIFSGGCKGA